MELPHVEKFSREMKAKGFGLLTVTSDKAADVRVMVDYNGITHPIVSDVPNQAGGTVYEKYHAYDGKHYLIASDGTIVATFSKIGISLPSPSPCAQGEEPSAHFVLRPAWDSIHPASTQAPAPPAATADAIRATRACA